MNKNVKFFLSLITILLLNIGIPKIISAETITTKEFKVMINADRLPPDEVSPVIIGQIKYEVIHWGKNRDLDHNGGYISATDLSTNQEIWVLKIYSTEYDSQMEEDVQDVFIKSMSKIWFQNKLKIINENGEKYLVDIDSKSVTRI